MKVNVALFAEFPLPGPAEAGPCSNSHLAVNGEEIPQGSWGQDSPFQMPTLQVGDVVEVTIPSGAWKGVVESVEICSGEYPRQNAAILGEWHGKANGLLGGMSGVCSWQAHIDGVSLVESSIAEVPIPWDLYAESKRVADELFAASYRATRDDIWKALVALVMGYLGIDEEAS